MKTFLTRRPLIAFFVLAYGFTWTLQGVLAMSNISIETTLGAVVNIVAIYGPFLAALSVAKALGPSDTFKLWNGFRKWRVRARWYIIALGLPLALMLGALAVNTALGGSTPNFARADLGIVLLTEFLRVLFFGGPLGEEPGWRGFALPRLQAQRSPIAASLVLGVLWGVWHLAIYFVPGTGQNEILKSGNFAFSFGGFLIWTIALSCILTWLYNRTDGSLILAILFHTSVNVAAFLPSALGVHDYAVSLLNVLFTLVVALLLAIVTRLKADTRARDDAQIYSMQSG